MCRPIFSGRFLMWFSMPYLCICLRTMFVLLLWMASSSRAASTFTTPSLVIENRTPILATTSIIKPDVRALPAANRLEGSTRAELINYLSAGNSGMDGYYIDGETWHLTQSLSLGVGDAGSLILELPWLRHGEGISDHFIYHFHDVLQLPQNGRTPNRHDQQLWDLRVGGQTLLRVEQTESGLGDVRLRWHQPLGSSQLGMALKLPTGDFDKQTGSDEFDLGVSLAQQNPDWFRQRNVLAETALALWYGVSLNYVQVNDLLADELDARPWILAARAGLGWQVSPRWILKTQIDANSPFFDSEIRELGWVPLMIGIASETLITPTTAFDFMIIEDLRPRTSPDVVLSLGLRYRF